MINIGPVKKDSGVDSYLTLFDLIVVLAKRRRDLADQKLAALGINHTEARLLSVLHHEGGETTQDVISAALLVDRSNAGRALKQLEAGGYVVRRKDDTDKRANLVRMTDKGRDMVSGLMGLKAAMAQAFFEGMTEGEVKAAAKLLLKTVGEEDLKAFAKTAGGDGKPPR